MADVMKYKSVLIGLDEEQARDLRAALRVAADLAVGTISDLSALRSDNKARIAELRQTRDILRSLHHQIGGLKSDDSDRS